MIVKDLNVKVTYYVGLGDVEIPDNIYEAMSECLDEGGEVPLPDECMINGREHLSDVAEWIADHIHEDDAYDWEYEIEDME
jgi:hypothetical protein